MISSGADIGALMNVSELVLASSSPRRSFLLNEMRLKYRVLPAEVEEDNRAGQAPDELVLKNASLKASWVAERVPAACVLGADTTVALGERVFNKPVDLDEAKVMLRALSGKTHSVYTGVCLIVGNEGFSEQHAIRSEVTFQKLDEQRIEEYFARVNPLDKAGAYGIQEGKELIIESLTGSLNNVMGLPTEFLAERFQALGLLEQFAI